LSLTTVSIDIGNTAIKAGVFESGALQNVFWFEDTDGLKLWSENLPSTMPVIISSVTNDDLGSFYQYFSNFIVLDFKTKVPVVKKYETPETLGNDRLASTVGAWALHPNQSSLVIDAGTAIKYDFVNSTGNYLGGSISPGVEMKFKALHRFTGKLPLIEKSNDFQLTGNSTEQALLSGVMHGTLLEMQGFIDAYSVNNENLQVIMTGGDSSYFADRLKGTIFAEPNLVLKGLFEILKYNAPQL
jgi:type III pantothenate kinase